MNAQEKIKKISVIVNNGSGVLVTCDSDAYSYIVTAKHNIIENNVVFDFDGTPITIQSIHSSNCFDFAVLKINKIIDRPHLNSLTTELSNNSTYALYGYPYVRRAHSEKGQTYTCELVESRIDEYIFWSREFPSQEALVGMSGAGVFLIIGLEIFLVGIETRVETATGENPGRFNCFKICTINNFLKENSLEPILSEYMRDFSYFFDKVFRSVPNFQGERTVLKNHVRALCIQIDPDLLPKNAFNFLKDKTLVYGQPENIFSMEKLWLLYFEYLLVCLVLSKNARLNFEELKKEFKKKKPVFAYSEGNWINCLVDVLESDLSELESGGHVIVCSFGDDVPNKYKISGQAVMNIAKVPKTKMIDQGIEDLYEELRFSHISLVDFELSDYDSKFYQGLNISNIKERFEALLEGIYND